jgi:hypothetical protein
MTYLTNLDPFPINSLSKGDVAYYADAHAIETSAIHLLQVTTVAAITSTSVLFDNGRKFLLSGEEVTRGNKGAIYAYTSLTRAMVSEAQNKLALLNEVKAVNFNSLSLQQLSMILDVSRGAFTQVTTPSPCGGGCNDTVGKPSQQSFIDSLRANSYTADTVQVAGIDIDISDIESIPTVEAPIGIADATYELSDEDEDEDDEEYAGNEDYDESDYLIESRNQEILANK